MTEDRRPHVVVLGAGPAGLGAAAQLSRRGLARVTVLEASEAVGGNAGSFDLAGLRVDYGSHRLHPTCPPEILRDLRDMLGEDLLDRPRHGRIRLGGRWIHYPLKPLDLALRLPPRFSAGVAGDMVQKRIRRNGRLASTETFATVLEAGLGRTICEEFYFPYAKKLWGVAPENLAETQARRRVSANSVGRMVRKVAASVPGLKRKVSGRFYYPRDGFLEISEAYLNAATAAGAVVELGARVEEVETADRRVQTVHYRQGERRKSLPADFFWSTIPMTSLVRALRPRPPEDLLDAAERLRFRSMILIYLVLPQGRFTEYDAHYFPEEGIPISRLSEPKNYSDRREPRDSTVLCAELPCAPDGPEWGMSDEELGGLVCHSLEKAGIPVPAPVNQVVTRRLSQAYPVYERGYEAWFAKSDKFIGEVDGLLTFGRQGLFAHDNTHHALHMAYSAANCLDASGRFDKAKWQEYRRLFETHVVED